MFTVMFNLFIIVMFLLICFFIAYQQDFFPSTIVKLFTVGGVYCGSLEQKLTFVLLYRQSHFTSKVRASYIHKIFYKSHCMTRETPKKGRDIVGRLSSMATMRMSSFRSWLKEFRKNSLPD